MLFDPFEEQLDLPATAIQLRDGQWRQREVVGQENQLLVLFGVEVTIATQLVWVTLARIEIVERNSLIADQARALGDSRRGDRYLTT